MKQRGTTGAALLAQTARLPRPLIRARAIGAMRRVAFFADARYFATHPASRARIAAVIGRSRTLTSIFAPHLNRGFDK